MTKVSVIIPCYNQGHYLDEAVESILSQTFQDFEIIVVDDGSTELSTAEKLKNYRKPKTAVYFKKNGGPSSARNFGIEKAKGEYILPLDADDYFEKTFLEKAVKILDENEKNGFVKCYVKNFGALNNYWKPKGNALVDFLAANQAVNAVLFRKSAWQEVGGYDETMQNSVEDWDFNIKMLSKGWAVGCIEEPLFFYRRKKYEYSVSETARLNREGVVKQLILNNLDAYKDNVAEIVSRKEKIISDIYFLNKIIREKMNYIEGLLDCVEDEATKNKIRTKITGQNLKELLDEVKGKKVCFYGAGQLAKNIAKSYDLSLFDLRGFVDSDPSKKHGKIGDYPIYSPDELVSLKPDYVVLTTQLVAEVYGFLAELKAENGLGFKIIFFAS